eukprot:m.354482 g.354482  ORF g.354482 m.354482 type:complete len:771 (+) comp17033_c0_seq1:30-2342(+)
MPRVFIKGGLWKNTEDEILKAAVMKYGPNQWARIASLLHRKSAKQCKRRWYEWLDPSIKKTEWSREEEEKLLHLAKLMPTQWLTIAPMIGRTPAQCLEHYERLLDQAQAADGGEAAEDARKLRPGEIDPNPHTRPARPDPIDMDEDEKEMLSEARARLANTQGKKAKRKARERQLEEAKRLAMLQKRRELRAAGINLRKRRSRRKQVDYNAEIPFEKKAPMGFFDPSLDGEIKPGSRRMDRREDVEGFSKREMEEKAQREDERKLEELKKKDMPAALMKMNNMRKDQPVKKRSKLSLPSPQVSDQELEDLVKLGRSGVEVDLDGSAPTGALLQDYSETPSMHQVARTPRAPAHQDSLLTEAQNILALNQTNSVLEGGENTPLHDGGGSFKGVTPDRAKLATPNRVLSTPYRGSSVDATPRSGQTPDQTPGSTPMRDKLGINAETDSALATPRTRAEKERQMDLRTQLREGLASLPAPQKQYDVIAPEYVEEATVQDDFIEDAADIAARQAEAKRVADELEMKRQSMAIQRKLPLPSTVNQDVFTKRTELDELQTADEMIKREMLDLLQQDKGLTKRTARPSDDEMAAARALLAAETEECMHEVHGDLRPDEVMDKMEPLRQSTLKDIIYLPAQQRYGRLSLFSKKDQVSSLELDMENIRGEMQKGFKSAAKMEKRLNIALGGYQKRAMSFTVAIHKLGQEYDETMQELKAFEALRLKELETIPARIQSLTEEVAKQEERQTELQREYKELSRAAATISAPAQLTPATASA